MSRETKEKFLKQFARYTPNDEEVWLIETVDEYKLRVNREEKRIFCTFISKKLLDAELLVGMEHKIKKAYDLGEMRISINYPSELFAKLSTSNLIMHMQQHFGKIGNGFFDGAKGIFDEANGTYTINLSESRSADLLRGMRADTYLSKTVEDYFGLFVEFKLISGAKKEYVSDEYTAMRQNTDNIIKASIKSGNESEEKVSFDSFEPIEGNIEVTVDENNENIITCGRMQFDITEPKLAYGKEPKSREIVPVRYSIGEKKTAMICGQIFKKDKKESRDGEKITFTFFLTDDDASTMLKLTCAAADSAPLKGIKEGNSVIVYGKSDYNKYEKTIVMEPSYIAFVKRLYRKDTHPEPRVELHLHTNMSQMDALTKADELVRVAKEWNLPAICVTDHGNVQSYPEIMTAAEKAKLETKIIYGMEGYLVDDTARATFGTEEIGNLKFESDPIIVFDIETTGLSPQTCGITEIAAVKYLGGEVVETFETFVDPEMPIPEEITRITGINDEMVKDAPKTKEAVKAFLDFADGNMLVAHNANFDTGFIRMASERNDLSFNCPYLDTLALSRYLNPELKRHRLDTLRDYFKLGEFNHHRALDDTIMLARIFGCMVEKLRKEGVRTLRELETAMEANTNPKKLPMYHISILVKNMTGLHNLYELISDSYLKYYAKKPRIPKTLLASKREGLIIGSACEAGELYSAVLSNKSDAEIKKIADFYDYFEIMPLINNMFLVDEEKVGSNREHGIEQLKAFNKKIYDLSKKMNKICVATGDVHFLEPGDEIFRKIMLTGMKFPGADRTTELYLKTTQEMLDEFSYLGEDVAYEVVVKNTRQIADMVEKGIRPIPPGAFNPSIENSDENLTNICFEKAKTMYGDPVPELVRERLQKELDSVIRNGYSALYITARELVKNSERNGYLVGSRGSVGSSVIATFAEISEVNPLPPHYRCPECKYNEFITDGSVGSGFDLPRKACPNCGAEMRGDGHDIPFETFLGFKGDKAPDIDLNFSGDIQANAHKYTEVLFGAENVFRAGTISTLAEKTAYGYVKKYLEEKGMSVSRCEEERLISGTKGVKRTTGQHPGGIVVVPRPYHITDFTPVQHPAEKDSSNIVTTHFAFEFLHDTLQKLDILGHDVPTRYKALEDYTGISVKSVPMDDENVMKLFEGTEVLGITPEQIDGIKLGTLAIPECGTDNARQMIVDAKPKTFADLMQFSGLSHGEGIWQGNAKSLIENGICTISEVIGTRDSIMLSLILKWGMDSSLSFKIMEDVRKGKGLKPEYEEAMIANGVPEWYITSCKKIQYMFPKAHAAAYMIAGLRLAWYKVYHPVAHYASYFTVQPAGFEAQTVMQGKSHVEQTIAQIHKSINDKTAANKDSDILTCLQIVNEMYARGIKFLPVDIRKSHSYKFLPEDGKIRLPLSSLAGLGETAAENIYRVTHEENITSLEELKIKASLTKSVVDTLVSNDCLGGLAETEQITLF